tara:strand:+ start:8120 stop:8839 length:720 start_codon:yes stop_codon:yes gene_type:complete
MTSRPDKASSRDTAPESHEVRQYLSDNPDFLTAHPDLLTELTPPAHHQGDGVLDMQHYMIDRLQKQVVALRSEQQDLIAASRSNMMSQARIHAAVLSLMQARTFEHLIEVVTTDLANQLDVDVVTLCVESDTYAAKVAGTDGVFTIPQGRVDEMLGEDRDIFLREDEFAEHGLFGGASTLVKSSALVRLRINSMGPSAVLALGSRDSDRFHPGQGTELLCFLSRVVAQCLKGWLNLPPS